HQMVDDMLAYLKSVRERPVWQSTPAATREKLRLPIPRKGEGIQQAYKDFLELVLPFPMGNIHPRFWGWVLGTGSPSAILTEMLAAGLNSSVFGGDQAPALVEAQVIDLCKEMLQFPFQASGLLVTGGSMANLVCLTVARNTHASFDLASEGLQFSPRP